MTKFAHSWRGAALWSAAWVVLSLQPASSLAKGTAPKKDRTFWVHSGEAQGVRCRVAVNGLVVWAGSEPSSSTSSGALNTYLRRGKNTVSIELSRATKSKQKPRFSFSIKEAKAGAPRDQHKTLLELKVGDAKPLVLPFKKSSELNLPHGPAVQLWKRAAVLTLNKKTRQQVRGFVSKIRGAVSREDVSRLMALTSFKIEESARATGRTLAASRQDFQDGYRMIFQPAGKPKLNRLNLNKLKLALLAEGRIIEVRDARGKHALRVAADELTTTIPLLLAKIDGAWQVAR